MQTEQALQKIAELREVVDGDVEDMVDTLATLVALKQDISNPMMGAKVTFYQKPEGEWVEVNEEEFEGDDVWWRRYDSYNEQYEMYREYTEKERIDHSDLPDGLDPDQPLEEDLEVAERLPGEWTIYEKDFRTYKRQELVEPTIRERRAIIFEPFVAEAPVDEYWDPNLQEYTTPEDYPMGTVNLIVGAEGDFGESYESDVEVHTSVPPAEGEPTPYSYTPGW